MPLQDPVNDALRQMAQRINDIQGRVGYFERGERALTPMLLAPRVTLAAPAGQIVFADIPQTYWDLLICLMARTDKATANDAIDLQLSGDSGANYDGFYGTFNYNNAFSSFETLAGTVAKISGAPSAGNTADKWVQIRIWIEAYSSTTGHKTIDVEGGDVRGTTSGLVKKGLAAACWKSSTPVTQVLLKPDVGTNFLAGTTASAYGLY